MCNNVQIMHPDANIDETRYLIWSISVLANDGILLSDFLISNDVLGGTLWVKLNMEISKSALLLANEHRSDQKIKCYKWFSYEFSLCICSRKNDSVNGMPENVASRRILTKMTATVFHRLWSNIKIFCSYKFPMYGYLTHEEADWKHPSFMNLYGLFHIAVYFSTLSWKWLV